MKFSSIFNKKSLLILGFICFALFFGCSKEIGEPNIYTGKIFTADQLRLKIGPFTPLGKANYAEVNTAALPWVYKAFRKDLSSGQYGILVWDDRSECTFFSTAFEYFAQRRFFAEGWASPIKSPQIAVGTIWYVISPGQRHAINIILSESGIVYFEPQTGKIVTLTPEQENSILFEKFD